MMWPQGISQIRNILSFILMDYLQRKHVCIYGTLVMKVNEYQSQFLIFALQFKGL